MALTRRDGFAALAAPGRPPIPGRLALVVAHPDDEAIGFGGTFDRAPDILVVHVTDGAPADMRDASRLGFPTRDAYAERRAAELATALDIAGVPASRRLALGLPDQATPEHLVTITRRLADLFRAEAIDAVFTHAYEGGHPDHDATAFAVAAAVGLLAAGAADVASVPEIIEMPFYALDPDGLFQPQAFPPDEDQGVTVPVIGAALARKQAMLQAHATQAELLDGFDPAVERFRMAPARSFDALSNGGDLFYPRVGSSLDGDGWLLRTAAARHELGLSP